MTLAIPNLQARLSGSRGALVDSNVLLDIATNDPHWADWSGRALSEVAEHTTLIINPIIYAEVSIGYANISKIWTWRFLRSCIGANRFLWRRAFWREKVSWRIAVVAAFGLHLCLTSTSVRMPLSGAWLF